MQLDRNSLEKIMSMDDESFVRLARIIAEAAGANKMKTEIMLNNPDMLKRKLANITPDEAKALMDVAGKEKSREIMEMLRGQGVNFGE